MFNSTIIHLLSQFLTSLILKFLSHLHSVLLTTNVVSHKFSFIAGFVQLKMYHKINSFTKVGQKLCNILVHASLWWLKQFKLWYLPAVVSSTVVVGVLTYCVLFHSVYDKFKLSYSVVIEATKNISYATGISTIDYSNQIVKEIWLRLQELSQTGIVR